MKSFARGVGLLVFAAGTVASVASEGSGPAAVFDPSPVPSRLWAVEFSSGILWSNVRDSRIPGYNLVPMEVVLARSFGAGCFKNFRGGLFEARPELILGLHWTQVERGTENHLAGVTAGLRYEFVGFSEKVVPFVAATVGPAWADSQPYVENGRTYGLGEDFNFNFNVSAGLRLDLSERWTTRVSVMYQHYSNAGLSEPVEPNRAIDALGFMVSLGWRF
jgi:opacity protein-like surface antigen